MKKFLFSILALFLYSTAQAETINVSITNFAFAPQVIDINQGDTVVWTNQDSAPHLLQANFGSSANLNTGDTFEFTFNEAGTFDYICQYHPSMTGTVRVSLTAAPSTSNPPENVDESEEEALLDEEIEPETNSGAVDFADVFTVDDSAETSLDDLFTSEPVQDISVPAENNVPAPNQNNASVVVTPPAPSQTENFNRSATGHHTAHGNSSLPTSGGNNWWTYLLVGVFLLGLFSLVGSRR